MKKNIVTDFVQAALYLLQEEAKGAFFHEL